MYFIYISTMRYLKKTKMWNCIPLSVSITLKNNIKANWLNYWRSYSISEGHTLYPEVILYIWRSYSISGGHTLYLKVILYIRRSYSISEGHTLYPEVILYIWRSYSISEGHTLYLGDARAESMILNSDTVLGELWVTSLTLIRHLANVWYLWQVWDAWKECLWLTL